MHSRSKWSEMPSSKRSERQEVSYERDRRSKRPDGWPAQSHRLCKILGRIPTLECRSCGHPTKHHSERTNSENGYFKGGESAGRDHSADAGECAQTVCTSTAHGFAGCRSEIQQPTD